ncbi:glycerophosphodiester phosphodiesterase family protein [Microbacterium sp. X-17]|uniref:glycerophosphodiester phosphodiesterase family protein n=1 Tax=Microbacterium sp. X-17 TaxID=3144404 RepID=UPI0031F5D0FC
MTHPYLTGLPVPRVLAHRGLVTADAASSGIVENSFAAVAAAHAAGADYVESDCHLTADGTVVLFHDPDLSRVTGDPRKLADVPLAELEDLMAERGGLITLEQALDAFPETRFNIDVKAAAAAAQAGAIVAPYAERVLLTSFSDERRREALTSAREVRADLLPATSAGSGTILRLLAMLVVRSARGVARQLAGIDALQVPERQRGIHVVTPRFIEAAHRNGVEVHVWTVNDPDDMRRLVAMGVDGIVTDRADVALAALS